MDYNELIIEIESVPLTREGIVDNLSLLLKHGEYLEQRNDVSDPLARGILDVAPPFIAKQVRRLQLHLDDEADIIAWISRSLMELLFMLRYMYSGRDQYDEVIAEQLRDLKNIEKVIYPSGVLEDDAPKEVKEFYQEMQQLWSGVQEYGVERDTLKNPKPAAYFAQGAGLKDGGCKIKCVSVRS